MQRDKGRYLRQKHTATEKLVILIALGLLCLTGIFPMVQVSPPVGVTENPETPNSAWSSLTNTSATGPGARFFVNANANGTKDFTQSSFSGTSSAQNMPVYTGSGWSIDRTMITISSGTLQDTRNYAATVGTLVTPSQWAAAPSVWSNWPTASGTQLAIPSHNTNTLYTDGGDAGSAAIQVNSRNVQDNIMSGTNFATGTGWTSPAAASADINTNNLQYYAWSRGGNQEGCWGGCTCAYHGGSMPSGWQSGYCYAVLNDDNVNPTVTGTAAPTIWIRSAQSACSATVGSYRIASAVTGYAYAACTNVDGCPGDVYAGHSFDRDYRRSYYTDGTSSYFTIPSGVMSKVELVFNWRFLATGSFGAGDANRCFEFTIKFQYYKPGQYPGTPIDIETITIKSTDGYSGSGTCNYDRTISLPTGALDLEGQYVIRATVSTRLRQYNSQGPNHGTSSIATTVTTYNDAIQVDLWNVRLNYEALTNYPTNSYTYLRTSAYNLCDLGARQLFGSDPTLNLKVLVPDRSAGTGESYYGSFVSAFVLRASDGAILACPSTWRLSTLTTDTWSTYRSISVPLTGFNTHMGSNTQFEIGVGIYFDTGGFRIGIANTFSFWIDTLDLSITARPTATQVGLTYQVYTAGGGWFSKAFTNAGYGGGTCSITSAECSGYGPSSDLEPFRFSTTSSGVSFSSTNIAYISYSDATTQYATYKAVSADTVNFYIDTNIPIPKVAGLADSLNYNSSLLHSLTIPKYTISSTKYWAFDRGNDPQNPGNVLSAETNPAAWQRAYQTLIDPALDGTYSQVLQFHFAAYSPQLIDKANVHWQLNFTAPNEIAASTDLKISTRSDFTPESDTFLLGETCYMRANYRTDAEADANPTNAELMTAVLMHNTGGLWNSSDGGANAGQGTTYNANFYIGQGKGTGYAAVVTYNISTIQASMPGVYRVGYRVKPFAVVRRTEVFNPTLNPAIYDTNNVAQNGSPIAISFTWRDAMLLTPIDSSDGTPVTAKITIDYWYAEAGFGYKMHAPENRPTLTAPLGWQDLTLQYNGAGVYACYPLPSSEWRTGANVGNITQGFKNFTITISKEGYQTQVYKGNFSIIVDAYVMFSTPVHDSYTDFTMSGQYLPHYMATGASAGENFSLYCALYERTPDEIDNTVDFSITNQFNNFYQGKITVNYQLQKFTDLSGGTERQALPDRVNWTYIMTTGYNYHNGTFIATGGPNYRLQLTMPLFRENSVGFGDGCTDGIGGEEKILWYNITFTVATNTTMVLYDPEHDYYSRDFQPNIVQNRSCENITTPGYNAGVPGPQAAKTGKINEEVQLIYLHKENTANITILTLVTTNDTDSGWAYTMRTNQHVLPDLVDTASPTMAKYQVVNYWKNETEYNWQGLPLVNSPYSGYGVEYKYMNRTDVIRFRVKYNCTYSQMQSPNLYVPPCGPLNKSSMFGWDGDATVKLYGWNSTTVNLTEDTNYLWNWTFTAGSPSGPQVFNIYGTTWITPWLNITEHNAVSYTDENSMPFISARKKGFNDGKLILNLTILAQATNMTIETNQETVEISRDEVENLANHATVKIPVGTRRSINFTYRDVTNAIYQPWASNRSYLVSGASISIEEEDDDGTSNHIYFNNATFDTWSYYEYPTIPGKYNITIWVPEGRTDMTLDGSTQFVVKAIRFKITRQNYQPKYINVDLNVTRRAIQLNLIWSKTVAPYSSQELFSLGEQGEFRHIVLSYEILDLELNEYVDLDDVVGFTPSSGDYKAAFSFDAFWDQKVYSAEEATYNGHAVYNITLWPTSNPAVNVIGTRDVKTTISQIGGSSLQNLYENSHNRSITIVAPTTEFRLTTANNTAVEYFAADIGTWDKSYMVKFTFQLVDLNHTALKHVDVSWPLISLDYNANSTWNNPWRSYWTTPFNNDAFMESILYGYMRDYTIYFDIQNISVGAYSVQLNLTKPNFPLVSVNLTFTITEVQTNFDSVKVNAVSYVTSGIVVIDDTIEKDIAWGDFMNITFDWRSTSAGRQAAIRNSSSTEENKTVLVFTGFPDAYIQWGLHQEEIAPGIYSIRLRSDLPVDISGDGYNMVFSFDVVKNNYETATFSFNITIRETLTTVKLYSGKNRGNQLGSNTIEVLWAQRLTFYFEMLADENPGPFDIFSRKYLSLDSIKINNTAADEERMWRLPDGTDVGDMKVTREVGLIGAGEYHYYFLVSMNTTILNVSTFPYPPGLTINFLVNKTNYKDATPYIFLRITPWDIQVQMSFGGFEGQYINKAEHKNFTLNADLYYEDQDNPGAKVFIEEDWFTVEWNLVKYNVTTELYDVIGGAKNHGTLTWNSLSKTYTAFVEVTDEMNGVMYIRFTVQAKNGNFKDVVIDEPIVFQNPGTELILWPLILAVGLIGVVSIYTIRKAAQLRIPLVLRLIDETITKIHADKYPAETGVLAGRNEFMVNTLLDRLEQVGIEWEKAEKFTIEETKGVEEKAQPPMSLQEINAAMDTIPELTVEEKAIFADELKRLARKEQDEFIASLKHQSN